MSHRLADLAIVCALAGIMALAPPGVRAHAQTLTPPPPPGATCSSTGSGIFCHGAVTDSGVKVDTGVSCGSFELLESYRIRTTFELWYNTDGLGTRGTFHDNLTGTFVNSVTGKTIRADAHSTRIATFSIPGDVSTLTRTITGAVSISTGAGFGLVSHDVGRIIFDSSFNVLFEGGPHDQTDNPTGFVDAVCTALG